MPVQITQIPNFQGQAINAPGMSANDPGAQALGNLAQSISGVSEAFAGHAQQIQKIENARIISENRQNLAKSYAEFQIENQKVSDPDQRIAKTDAFLSSQKAKFDQPGFSPYVKATLTDHYDEFATRAFISSREDAANLSAKRAGLALSNELETAVLNNDTIGHTRALDTAQEAGILLPEQRKTEEMRFAKITKDRAIVDSIMDDPDLWLQYNPSPQQGQAPAEWEKYRSFAKSKFREETADTVKKIQEGIASRAITTTEQIDQLAGNLRPTSLAILYNDLAQQTNEDHQAKLRAPEYQAQLIGQASAMLKSYDPNGEDFDSGYVAVDSVIRQLPPSAIRDELNKQLDAKRNDEEKLIKTHADQAQAAINDHFDRLEKQVPTRIPLIATEITTTRAINDGFLRDKTKLPTLGFTEDQAEEIIGEEDDTDAERKARFIKLASQRKGTSNADGLTTATAEAILNGSDKIIIKNPEAEGQRILEETKLRTQRGKALRELTDFVSIDGKTATTEQINQKVFEIAGRETRAKLQSGFFDDEEEAENNPKGADSRTSALPVGKDLKTVVKQFEAGGAKNGFHRTAYWDNKQWSIGYGTKSKQGEVIDQAEAEQRLDTELSQARRSVEREAARLKIYFNPAQIDALTSFTYNLGEGVYTEKEKTGLKALLANGTRTKDEIANKMLLYINGDGQKLEGLKNRRHAERHLFLNGY